MRDRLIELLKKADKYTSDKGITDYEDAVADNADYLLANGVIVPPCKVGGKVYAKVCYLNGIHQFQITNITITQNKKGEWTKKYRAMRVVNGKTIDSQINFDFHNIGKTVFRAREEAEAKLKGEQ